MRRPVAVAIAVLAGLSLAGCDQFLPEPLSYTVVDGVPIARTCIPLTVSLQAVRLYSSESDYDGHVAWQASGSADLPSGTEFELGQPMEGLSSSFDLDQSYLEGAFTYEMKVDAGRGGSWMTRSRFDAGVLREGVWVDSWGEVQNSPCHHEPCSPIAACYNNWPLPTGSETNTLPTLSPTPGVSATP